MKLADVTDRIIEQMKRKDYTDINKLRDDVVDALEALRNELHGADTNHVFNYHASGA